MTGTYGTYEEGFKAGAEAERAKMTSELRIGGFDEITSGRKVAKKLRQQYSRSLKELSKARVDGLYKTFEDHIRPCPKLIPAGVWKVIQRIVLIHYV